MNIHHNKVLIFIISIISTYYLYLSDFVSKGEIGSIGFELLQLLYCILATIWAVNLPFTYYHYVLLYSILTILLVHILRLIINIKEIFIISSIYKHIILDIISFIYIYYIFTYPTTINNIYLLGFLYYIIAVNSFSNKYYNYNINKKHLHINILVTLGLIFVYITHLLKYIEIPNNIIPIFIGDSLYHIHELFYYI